MVLMFQRDNSSSGGGVALPGCLPDCLTVAARPSLLAVSEQLMAQLCLELPTAGLLPLHISPEERADWEVGPQYCGGNLQS